MKWIDRKHEEDEDVDTRPAGYYLMHTDYPGGRRESDPTVEQIYEVLRALSPTILNAAMRSLTNARSEYDVYRKTHEGLQKELNVARGRDDDLNVAGSDAELVDKKRT